MLKFIKSKIKISSSSLSLIGLVILLMVTWLYLQDDQIESREELHATLQEKVQEAISDYVERKNPNVKSITFQKVWTKNTGNPEKIKIFFSYSLVMSNQGKGHLLIDGEALLNQSSEDINSWILSNFKVTNSFLDFSESMIIKSTSQK